MKNDLLATVILVFGLSSCGIPATPSLGQTVSPTTAIAPSNSPTIVITPTNTPISVNPTEMSISPTTVPASPTALLFTDPSIQLSERIVYYYFVTPAENPVPEGSITISSTYILAPTFSDLTYSPETVDDLRRALEVVLNDGRNGWISSKLKIVDITFDGAHANVVIQGEYFGVGDVTLMAAGMQILMTVFANPSVQTATVTLNGETIGNLGISNSMNAKPANYVFTRDEIETFLSQNAYVSP